jgi:hypothetical protein
VQNLARPRPGGERLGAREPHPVAASGASIGDVGPEARCSTNGH